MCSKFCSEPRAAIFPIRPRVDASIDCIAGFMAVIDPETVVRVNWVKSCWRDERLVAAVAAAAVDDNDDEDDEPPGGNGDIKFDALLVAFGLF